MRENVLTSVYPDDTVADEPDVTPRPAKMTDATKLTVPVPYMISLIGLAVVCAAGVWRIEGKVGQFETAMQYERELDQQREKYLDQRFTALESKIESAGLRNFAMQQQSRIDELAKKR